MRRDPSNSSQAPSVVEPRRVLVLAVRSFVRAACTYPGVLRIALMGSLATSGAIPKDADVLVTINGTMDLGELARAGRRLKGSAQAINLGADVPFEGGSRSRPETVRRVATGPWHRTAHRAAAPAIVS
jgi:hypothetical protein